MCRFLLDFQCVSLNARFYNVFCRSSTWLLSLCLLHMAISCRSSLTLNFSFFFFILKLFFFSLENIVIIMILIVVSICLFILLFLISISELVYSFLYAATLILGCVVYIIAGKWRQQKDEETKWDICVVLVVCIHTLLSSKNF